MSGSLLFSVAVDHWTRHSTRRALDSVRRIFNRLQAEATDIMMDARNSKGTIMTARLGLMVAALFGAAPLAAQSPAAERGVQQPLG